MLLKTAKLLGIDINPKHIWNTDYKFITYDEALDFSNKVDGIIIDRGNVLSKYRYIVKYSEYRHKVPKVPKVEQQYLTVTFSSINSANSFKNRLIKEGLELNVNQDIIVKESKGLFKVRFLLDKTKPKKDSYTDKWCEYNMNGSFAYNNSSDDF